MTKSEEEQNEEICSIYGTEILILTAGYGKTIIHICFNKYFQNILDPLRLKFELLIWINYLFIVKRQSN